MSRPKEKEKLKYNDLISISTIKINQIKITSGNLHETHSKNTYRTIKKISKNMYKEDHK